MEPRPGWRFMNPEGTGIVHEWRAGLTPRCTGMVIRFTDGWRWRVSFWDDADAGRSSRSNPPAATAEEAMEKAEAVIFAEWRGYERQISQRIAKHFGLLVKLSRN